MNSETLAKMLEEIIGGRYGTHPGWHIGQPIHVQQSDLSAWADAISHALAPATENNIEDRNLRRRDDRRRFFTMVAPSVDEYPIRDFYLRGWDAGYKAALEISKKENENG